MSSKAVTAKCSGGLVGLIAVLGLSAIVLQTDNRASAGDNEKSPVKLTAKAGKIEKDGHQTVTVIMEVNKGWHTYANPVNCEMLAGTETVLKITSANKLEEVKVEYPTGTKTTDELMGVKFSYMVYEGKIELNATVKRAAGDTGPLDLSVKYNACNDKGQCLAPAQVKLQVK